MAVELLWAGKEKAWKKARCSEKAKFPLLKEWKQHLNAHALFIADNLKALQCFKEERLRFHFMYIDPPYNTGHITTYFDAHPTEDDWLSFMTPRLLLARDCLAEEGLIFISIDDNEQAALHLLCFEIFGKENYVGTIKWRRKRKPSFLASHFSSVFEYILVFAKDIRKAPKLRGEKTSEQTRPVLNATNPMSQRILRAGTPCFLPDGEYSAGIRTNRTLTVNFCEPFQVREGRLLNDVRVEGRFRVSQDLLDKTVYITPKFGLRRYVAEDEFFYRHATDDASDWPTNEDADKELRKIFNQKVFAFPKPVGLLQRLIEMVPYSGSSPMLCLDFFAGTGTLFPAVLAANEKDGVSRLCVLVQHREKLGNTGRDIADLTQERILWEQKRYPQALLHIEEDF